MKKNLFSAALFSALLLVGSGTMTSCNKYDDDISSLQEQITALEAELSSVPDQFESVEATLADLSSLKESVTALQAQVGSTSLSTVLADITSLESEMTTLKNSLSSTSSDLEATKSTITTIQSSLSSLEALAATLATSEDLTNLSTDIATQIADIYVEIAGVEAGIKSWVGEEIANALADYVTVEAYEANILSTQAQIDALNTAIETAKTEAGEDNEKLETALREEIQALESKMTTELEARDLIVSNLTKALEDLKLESQNEDGELDAAIVALTSRVASLESQDSVILDMINDLDDTYATDADLTTKLETLTTEYQNYVDGVKSELNTLIEANSTLISGLTTSLEEVNNKISINSLSIENMKIEYMNAIGELDAAIVALKNNVTALEARVTSMVWVPNSLFESTLNLIVFDGAKYFDFGTTRLYLNDAGYTTTVKFQVVPAAAAVELAKDENQSFVTIQEQEMSISRSAAGYYTVNDITCTDEVNGIIEVKVTSTYPYELNNNDNKTLAIAAKVNYSDGEYVSSYIGTMVETATAVNDAITLGTLALAEGSTVTRSTELVNKAGNSITYFGNDELMYGNAKLSDLAATYGFDIAITAPTTTATTTGVDANYNLTDNSKLAISTVSIDNIGDVVTSGEETITLTYGTETITYYVNEEVTITADVAKEILVAETAKFTWFYKSVWHTSDELSLPVGSLTAAEYLELANLTTLGGNLVANLGTETETETLVNNFSVQLTTAPTADTDVQWFTFKLKNGNFVNNFSGHFVIEFQDPTTGVVTELQIPIEIVGMPTLNGITIEKAFDYDLTNLTYELGDYYTLMTAVNTEAAKQFDTADFKAGLDYSFGVNTDPLYIANGKVYVTFTNNDINNGDVNLSVTAAPFGLDADVKVTTSLSANDKWTRVDAFFAGADDNTVIPDVVFDSNGYSIAPVELNGAYTTDDVNSTIQYIIDPSQDFSYLTNEPTILGGVLSWGDYTGTEVKIIAQLVVGTMITNTANIVATIPQPIDGSSFAYAGEPTITRLTTPSINLFDYITLNDLDGNTVVNTNKNKLNDKVTSTNIAGSLTFAVNADDANSLWTKQISLDPVTGEIKFEDTVIAVQTAQTLYVDATYTDDWGTNVTIIIPVIVGVE